MKNLRIFHKIFLSHILIGMISVIALSFIFYQILSNALIQRTIDQLSSVNILKRNQIEMYFSRTQKNLDYLFNETNLEESFILLLDSSSRVNKIQEIDFVGIRNFHSFKNILLYDKNFKPVFSISKNFIPSEILSKELKNVDVSKEYLITADIAQYSYLDSIANIVYVHPLKRAGEVVGFIVVQDNFQKIQEILFERTGMGTTGESYLVGKDLYMRSASRFFPDSIPLSIKVTTEAVVNAFKNKEGNDIVKDYRGIEVLSVYRSIEFSRLNWAIVSEMDFLEAMKPIRDLQRNVVLITVLILFLVLLLTLVISNAISKPVLFLKEKIIELSKGIFKESQEVKESKDEIGEMALATRQLIQGLKRTADFAHEIGSGNFQATYTTLSDQDDLGFALISMRDRLKELTEREVRLIKERASALIEGQEKERSRIIRELHDGVGQLLTVINLRLQAMEEKSEIKEEIKGLVKETIAEVRRISYNVMPGALVDFGLEPALRGLLENIKKYSGITYELNYVKEVEFNLNFDIRIAVYRIVQEALNNIIKYSDATHVEVNAIKSSEEFFLLIKDNGKGFNLEAAKMKGGFGLQSMTERANLLHGRIEIHTSEGKGTIIEVTIPITKV